MSTTTTKSKTACLPSIFGCMKAAEEFLGEGRIWQGVNQQQRRLLQKYFGIGIRQLDIPEIKSMASWRVEAVNHFLADHGFDITLKEFAPNEFGVASIMNLLVEWPEACKKTQVRQKDSGIPYPAIHAPGKNTTNGDAYDPVGRLSPAARLQTVSGDFVYIAVPDGPVDGGYIDLYDLAESYHQTFSCNDDHSGVVLPMIDLDQEVDISWLLGMETTDQSGGDWRITQAKQQNKLRLNEIGARAESATAMGVQLKSVAPVKGPLVVDRPFLIWFWRPGVELPLFVGYIGEEDWKEPSKL